MWRAFVSSSHCYSLGLSGVQLEHENGCGEDCKVFHGEVHLFVDQITVEKAS